jgi:hypothetical protein
MCVSDDNSNKKTMWMGKVSNYFFFSSSFLSFDTYVYLGGGVCRIMGLFFFLLFARTACFLPCGRRGQSDWGWGIFLSLEWGCSSFHARVFSCLVLSTLLGWWGFNSVLFFFFFFARKLF